MWGSAEQLGLELNGQDDLGLNLAESLNLGTLAYYSSTQVVEAGSSVYTFPPHRVSSGRYANRSPWLPPFLIVVSSCPLVSPTFLNKTILFVLVWF